ncbi:TetR/AcrR family transcriptional regulator [Ornithinibacillus salinisoli]|uniref:TetR/AcrR family transcriptional regulator n=1 Tax=Ornithinibacillus salinisoli TaxID=1848459 RepID=A0ABW4VYA8_9BACI
MAPLNEDQLKDIREERKIQIMNAAMKVFANNGIKLTKISMIAKEAKVSHGLVYHYFNSKEEVLFQSLEWAMETATMEAAFQELNNMPMSPLEKIKHFTTFALSEGNSDVFRVIQHVTKSEDIPQHISELIEQSGKMYLEFLYPLFAEGQETGEIYKGDTQELLETYLNILSGIMSEDLQWWKQNIDQKVNILLRMLSSKK